MVTQVSEASWYQVRGLASVDHFVPRSVSRGRVSPFYNVVLACRWCNSRAGSDMPDEDEVERFIRLYEQAAALHPNYKDFTAEKFRRQLEVAKQLQHRSDGFLW